MEIRDALARISGDLGALLEKGQEFVHIPTLLAYLKGIEQNAPAISQAAELQHQSQLAYHRAVHESNLEMFKSVIETGKTAVTTAILVSGGATVALLAFVGNLQSKTPAVPIPGPLLLALTTFALGVLLAAVASGARYLSQLSYANHWLRSGIGFHVLCIALVIGSYVSFGVGVIGAYLAFIR